MSTENVIREAADFEPTPEGWAARWEVELKAARDWAAAYQASSAVSVERFLDQRDERLPDGQTRPEDEKRSRVNLYWSNVVTQRSLLYGRTPEVSVKRRFDDAKDSEARLAGSVILKRLLDTDIERGEDGYRKALRNELSDFLTMGLAWPRVRYACDFEEVEQPAKTDAKGKELAPAVKKRLKCRDPRTGLPKEDVLVDYVHWRDMLWSPCRTFEELRWWAYRTAMSKDAVKARFGEDVANAIPYGIKVIASATESGESKEDPRKQDPWNRTGVWEIWSKELKKVFWFVEGYGKVLEEKNDPYGLVGFWPFPEPLMSNLTTEKFLPRSDYALAQDLYNDINEQSTRIALLERAIRVAGVYDQSCGPLERLITEGYDNVLIPVEKWPALQEKGGLKGAINWLPLDQIVAALEQLKGQRTETRQLLYEVTGWSDLMRGQSEDSSESATGAAGKMRFASSRLQHRQDEFARLASELQCLRGELIARFFDSETIAHRANVAFTEDGPLAAQRAIEQLKKEYPSYRIEVLPEALAQQDFAALKNERLEVLQSIAQLTTSATAMSQVLGPQAMPVFVELAKWAVGSLRGSATIEGVLDRALQQAQEAAQRAGGQPLGPPDPKAAQTQAKAQADMQKTQAELQADLVRGRAESQEEMQRQEAQYRANVAEAVETERTKTAEEAKRELLRDALEQRRAALRPPTGAPPRRKP